MEPIHLAFDDALRRAGISRAQRLLLAVSGGGDSTALLYAGSRMGLRVGVAHVHHGLRGAEADADAEFVRRLARDLGLPCRIEHAQVEAGPGRSPEARARVRRYAVLERIRREGGYDCVATAHSLDDQAETVLLRASRGAGPAGLAGIAPSCARRRLVRPFLEVRRAALREYLRRRGFGWREDTTNSDLGVPRNRVRHEVLPSLERVHAGASVKLAELARSAHEQRESREPQVAALLARAARAGDGGWWLDPDSVCPAPAATRRAVLLRLLSGAGAEPISRKHLLRIEEFLEGADAGLGLSLPRGRVLTRDRDEVWLGPGPGPRYPAPLSAALTPPRALELPQRGMRLSWKRAGETNPAHEGLNVLSESIRVRSPREGDRLRVVGSAGRPLRDLFRRAGWSRRQRAYALVVEADGDAVWVPGLLPAPVSARGDWKLVAERIATC